MLVAHFRYQHHPHHRGRRGRIPGEKAPRKKKDPNAPKGPGNVFFLFCRLERDKVKDAFPQESLGDVTKLLGQKWKGLTREEKQVRREKCGMTSGLTGAYRNITTCTKRRWMNMKWP